MARVRPARCTRRNALWALDLGFWLWVSERDLHAGQQCLVVQLVALERLNPHLSFASRFRAWGGGEGRGGGRGWEEGLGFRV